LAASQNNSSGRGDQVIFTSRSLEREPFVATKEGRTGSSHNFRAKSTRLRSPKDGGPAREVHVATRVKDLCHSGKFDQAVEVCMNAPAALQGAPAWNTVIYHALSQARYSYAYTLYQQVRKFLKTDQEAS
jgi:hypothetical protein